MKDHATTIWVRRAIHSDLLCTP